MEAESTGQLWCVIALNLNGVSAHRSPRFGAQLTVSGNICGLPVSMDQSGTDFTSEEIHKLTIL
jgi:hypothetical protein